MTKILILAAAAMAIASPAHAGPVAAAVAWIGSTLAAGGVGAALLRIGIGLGFNLLSTAIAKGVAGKPKINVQFDVELGDDSPLTFIVGDYVTAGKLKYVGSWGKGTRYVTEVIEVSALPQPGLFAAWFNDEVGDIRWDQPAMQGADLMGYPVKNFSEGVGSSNERDRCWVKLIDGTQTVADGFLVSRFGADPDYPWTADMVGAGKTYAVLTYYYDPEVMTARPALLCQPEALPMYDPRLDDSAGGAGAHRWGDRSSYASSRNPAVIAYNIARGIYVGDEWVFGGRNLPAWRLPAAEWFAAMNACDAPVTLAEGGAEPAFRCGLQISADMTPADVLEEIGRAANMRFAEVGGMLKPIVGLPGAAAFAFTDDSILITEGQSYKPFNSLGETFNALSATYPEPAEKWSSKDAPEYVDADAETADNGRYLPTSISYPAAPYRNQVQRLMRAQMRDYRRMRVHQFYLSPEAIALEPLVDMVAWSSNRNGYDNKLFIVEQVDPMPAMNVMVTLREVDPGDYDWSSDFELPSTVVSPVVPVIPAQVISGLAVLGVAVQDSNGAARRAALRVICDGDEVGVTDIQLQVRRAGEGIPFLDVSRPFGEPYRWLIMDVLPMQSYEVRARLLSEINPRSEWSGWLPAATPDIRLGRDDIADDILTTLDEMGGITDQVAADLAALSDDVDLRVRAARDDLGEDIDAVELQLTQGLAAIPGQIETGIQDYDVTVQGQFMAMAGEIADLTAALTSADLIQNGDFATGDMSYWTATGGGAIREKATSTIPLVQSAPTDYVRQVSYGGSIIQQSQAFTVSSDDRFQVRFSIAGPNGQAANRQVELTAEWLDGSGDPIGTPDVVTLGFQRNVWQVITHQFDPPDAATSALLTFDNPGTGDSWFVTGVSASTVNVEVLARVVALEAAQASTDSALSTFQTQALARFDTTDAAVASEAAARASADGAISDRLDTVETTTGTNAAAITAQQTALTNAEEAIAQVDQRMTATFGRRQVVRDPVFDEALTFWPVGGLGSVADLVARDSGSEFAVLNAMPAGRSFSIPVGAAGLRMTSWYDCAPGDVFAISAHFFQQTDAPSGSFWVQFQDDAGALLSQAFGIKSGQVGAWHIQGRRDVVAPTGAVKVRAILSLGNDGTGANRVYITNCSVERLLGFDFMADAEFTEVRQAQANADGAFTAYVASANSRFNGVDGMLASHATALSNRYTRTEADAAMAGATSAVTARTNRASASGLMRVTSVAAGDDALTRIGLMAEASNSSTNSTAAFYLDARSGGVSQVSVVADRFAVVTGTGGNAPRQVPFYVANNAVYMDTAIIRVGSFETIHLAGNSVTIPASATLDNLIRINDGDPERGLCHVIINRQGAPTKIDFMAQLGGFRYEAIAMLHLKRNGVTIVSLPVTSANNGTQTSVGFSFEDENLDVGITTFQITATRFESGSYRGDPAFYLRTISALHTMR
ncbi:MAG: hypothetical protein ACK5LJ_05105 [Paracoccus sp. (in: a-proteobacteria)]